MRPLQLEVFESDADASEAAAAAAAAARAAETAAAYEAGLCAGRAEAAIERESEERHLRAEVAARLEALSFTWEEARSQLLAAIEPLMTAIVAQVLPEMARHALVPMAVERLIPLAGEIVDTPLELAVPPALRAQVEALLHETARPPVAVVDSPDTDEGQVTLRAGDTARRIDLGRVTREIAAAMHAFFATTGSAAAAPGPALPSAATAPMTGSAPPEDTLAVWAGTPAETMEEESIDG